MTRYSLAYHLGEEALVWTLKLILLEIWASFEIETNLYDTDNSFRLLT